MGVERQRWNPEQTKGATSGGFMLIIVEGKEPVMCPLRGPLMLVKRDAPETNEREGKLILPPLIIIKRKEPSVGEGLGLLLREEMKRKNRIEPQRGQAPLPAFPVLPITIEVKESVLHRRRLRLMRIERKRRNPNHPNRPTSLLFLLLETVERKKAVAPMVYQRQMPIDRELREAEH